MPLVEEYNLDDILGDIEKESLVSQMKRKAQRTTQNQQVAGLPISDYNSKMSDSTDEDSGAVNYGPKALNQHTEIPKLAGMEQELLRQ